MAKKKKYYVVWKGHETGVFGDWPTTQKLTHGYPDARFKSFETREEAESAFAAGPKASLATRSKPATLSSRRSPATPTVAGSNNFDVSIYCDGACEPNPGKAGSGVAVYRNSRLVEAWYGLYNPDGTNNSAELNALLKSLERARDEVKGGLKVQILSDSQYSIKCVTQWAAGWSQKGWKKKDGEIKNLELIQTAYALYLEMPPSLHVGHVAAHVGIEGNEVADRMAVMAVDHRQTSFVGYEGTADVASILSLRSG